MWTETVESCQLRLRLMRQGLKEQGTALLPCSAANIGPVNSDDKIASLPELENTCATSYFQTKKKKNKTLKVFKSLKHYFIRVIYLYKYRDSKLVRENNSRKSCFSPHPQDLFSEVFSSQLTLSPGGCKYHTAHFCHCF